MTVQPRRRRTDLEILRDWANECAAAVGTDRVERRLWRQIAAEVGAYLDEGSLPAVGAPAFDFGGA